MLTPAELSRYARQLVLPEVGIAGQEKLRAARILVVGAGGLGSPAALYLAAAGVGTIGLIDDDRVELSNLHRQILHTLSDVGREKTDAGADALSRLNDQVVVRRHRERLSYERALALAGEYDLVVDGSDNYPTRYALNDACAALRKPWVYGSVERYAGQVAVFGWEEGPCYRCVFPDAPAAGSTPSCEQIGVLGAVPGVIGSLQAVEALKCILGIGEPLSGRLLQLDLLSGATHVVEVPRRPDCAACGSSAQATTAATTSAAASDDNGSESDADIEPAELANRMRSGEKIALLDIREPWEASVARIADSRLLPMNQLPVALNSLARHEELIVYCHHGARSSMAAGWLRQQGFRARSLAGGIDRWSQDVDPAVPRY